MAYAGYLVKLGGASGTAFPLKYIRTESYDTTPNQRMESEAGRATTGLLHRTTIEHTSTKIEFETPPLTNEQLAAINSMLAGAMSDTHRRDITIQYYDMETDSYKIANCYMPDVKYTINVINGMKVIYKPVRYAFIEY